MGKARAPQPTAYPVWVVDAASADAFAERVFDSARLPVLVLVSTSRLHGDRPLVDVGQLQQQLGEIAEIAVMADDAASWVLSKHLARLSAWGGAVRVYCPDATAADSFERHPLLRVDPRRPHVALAQITAQVRAAAGLTASVRAPLIALPAPAPSPERDAVRWDAERDRLADQLADRDRLRREKDATIAELRREVQRLTKKLRAGPGAGPDTAVVYADPERQFRYEVEQHWLTSVPESEREVRALAGYRLGRDWLASLEAIELVGRRKILDVVVDVLTGRVVDVTARRVRRMRSSDGGGSAPRVREDGAVAWRCDIKHRTASAPRLMWWKLPDGAIELGRVAPHDDMQLR
ncbi:hypothetical protein ACWCQZ_46745 [Streptomyces sp. NPDC002285]